MRIAIISDIHGNLVALETVLANISREQPDQIVCLGDVALTGPQPHRTVEGLRALKCRSLWGIAMLGSSIHSPMMRMTNTEAG